MARFGTVLTAMVTPFDEDGALDIDAAIALARWLVDNGNDGLVIAGTTGEAPALSDEEKVDLWRAVANAVTVPVIAGSTTSDTEHSIALTKMAAAAGVDAILVLTPYYSRPSQAGIDAHFRAVAGAVKLPVMIYDIPIRTGRKVAHDTFVRLARDVPNIVAVKDAAADPAASAVLVAETPDSFELYSGDDKLTLPLLSIGGVGLVGVATHWAGALHSEMIAAFQKGDVDHAQEVNARLLASHAFESTDDAPNPIPAKAMMRVLGHAVGQCRLPMGPAPAGLEDKASQVLADLGTSLG
jgi:4-hydroxy-tetrahydrodipicolinate synthase